MITDCGESWKRFWGLFLPWFSLSLSMFFLFGDKPLTRFPVMLCLYLTFIPPSASLPFPPPSPTRRHLFAPYLLLDGYQECTTSLGEPKSGKPLILVRCLNLFVEPRPFPRLVSKHSASANQAESNPRFKARNVVTPRCARSLITHPDSPRLTLAHCAVRASPFPHLSQVRRFRGPGKERGRCM